MSVWYCLPSARPAEEAEKVLKLWRERGYRLALWRDPAPENPPPDVYAAKWSVLVVGPYEGYAKAQNALLSIVMRNDPSAEWFVCGGDDTEPDPNHSAEEIARECSEYFALLHAGVEAAPGVDLSVKSIKAALRGVANATFGVMQPTGDRWGINPKAHEFVSSTPGCNECACRQCGRGKIAPIHLTGAYIDRVAGSPWIGRSFAERINGGRGPYLPEFQHMFVDQCLQEIAIKHGCFWQRPDLIHLHKHWGRGSSDMEILSDPVIPPHLEKWNTAEHWRTSKAIFDKLKAQGWPGSDPL